MKKLCVLLVVILFTFISLCAVYSSDLKSKIEIIEQETKTYGGEDISIEKRLENAELYVFGEKKFGNLEKRANAIAMAIGISFNDKVEDTKYEIEDDVLANYPAIDNLEQQILGKTFQNENVYKRLDRLETKVFGKKSELSLNERVSNLENKFVAKKEIPKETNKYNYYAPNSYNKENLSKLENKYMQKQFDDEDRKSRLERIKAIEQAQKSQKEYKANKFGKYAATGLQIGGIVLLILAMIL